MSSSINTFKINFMSLCEGDIIRYKVIMNENSEYLIFLLL